MPMTTSIDQRSPKLDPVDEIIVCTLHLQGFQHKRIAALYDVNLGRVTEILGRHGLLALTARTN